MTRVILNLILFRCKFLSIRQRRISRNSSICLNMCGEGFNRSSNSSLVSMALGLGEYFNSMVDQTGFWYEKGIQVDVVREIMNVTGSDNQDVMGN